MHTNIIQVLAALMVALLEEIVVVTLFHRPRLVTLYRFETAVLVRMENHTVSLGSVRIA